MAGDELRAKITTLKWMIVVGFTATAILFAVFALLVV